MNFANVQYFLLLFEERLLKKLYLFLQFFENCKKIEVFETAKNWIYETFFTSNFFYTFQNRKKIAYGDGDFIFHNFIATATATATVWKSSFLQF